MVGRAIRIIVLLWLGWYISGPVAATFDTWDGPRQEFHDIQFNAGGGVVVVAAVFCFAFLLAKKFRERLLSPVRSCMRAPAPATASGYRPVLRQAMLVSNHSPPFPIRI